jgi:hypothetical protein
MKSKNNGNRKLVIPSTTDHNMTFAQQIAKVLGSISRELSIYSKEEELSTKTELNAYFNTIQDSIKAIKDPVEICNFLLEEQRKQGDHCIKARIDKDGYSIKYHQALIEVILSPLYQHWQQIVEFNKENPKPAKLSISTPTIPKKDVEASPAIPNLIQEEELPENEPLGPADHIVQIECNATKEQIYEYFSVLTIEKNHVNNKPYMTTADLERFLNNNFAVFGSQPTGGYIPINLIPGQKHMFISFVYYFHFNYSRVNHNQRHKYGKLLIQNFILFKDDKLKTLLSNFSPSKKPHPANMIPIPNNLYSY